MDNNAHKPLGVLTGAAAGAAIGILMAPDKGTKTRKRILRSIHEAKDHR